MIGTTISSIRNAARHTRLLWLVIFALASTQANAQGNDAGTAPTALYSYLADAGRERQFIDLGALAREFERSDYTIQAAFQAAFSLEARTPEELKALRSDPLFDRLNGDTTQHLGAGLLEGGASSGAALVMLGVAAIAAEKCEALNTDSNDNFVLYKDAILGRSSLRAVQFSIDETTELGLGRGQFDIYTTKFAICRNTANNDIAGIPINVRWVFNVNDDSLTTRKGDLSGPKGRPYKQNFHAEGDGIQVVLMEIDGQAVQPGHPVYRIVEDACIDIWLPEVVDTFDVDFPVSILNAGVFCAGGYCKGRPPGLDATQ
ncbi:hypothetical protein [uncultured Tateyamaria sp.]|uniref:hypothetical protein n=1 Tax=uncultured Tateyamaria sp. TaxID=455651 RepID=UPI00261749DD|nr:hypothetical protein [uncultured Tateyamaria sp.]